MGNIIAVGMILVVLCAAMGKMYYDKKKNVSPCGCACTGCPSANSCGSDQPKGKIRTVK